MVRQKGVGCEEGLFYIIEGLGGIGFIIWGLIGLHIVRGFWLFLPFLSFLAGVYSIFDAWKGLREIEK